MKMVSILIALVMLTFPVFAGSDRTRNSSKSHIATKDELKSIELFDGLPPKGKKYTKIGPILGSCATMECATKQAKRQAVKMGANAIINVTIEQETVAGAYYMFGTFVGTSQKVPVVKGWGVKLE